MSTPTPQPAITAPPARPVVKSSLPSIFFTDEMPRPYPAVFMYGIAGSGKTNALRTLAHLKPLVLATEDGQTKGMSTLADMKYPAIMIDNLDELVAVTSELSAKAKPNELYYNDLGPFGCLVLDSCTGVGPMLEDAAKKMKGWDMIWTSEKGKDPRMAYPYIAEKGRMVVRKLMALPVPLIMTCREQIVTEGEAPNAVSYPAPELPGQKLPRELPGWPEATIRIRMINNERVFQTENEGNVVARVRLPEGLRLPKFTNTNLGALVRLLCGDAAAIKDLERTPVVVPQTPQQLAASSRSQVAGTTIVPSTTSK